MVLIFRKYKQFGDRSKEVAVRKNTQAANKLFSIIGSYILRFRQGILRLFRIILSRPYLIYERKKYLSVKHLSINPVFHSPTPLL